MKKSIMYVIAASLYLTLATVTPAYAAVIVYAETYQSAATTGDKTASFFGWTHLVGDNATDVSATNLSWGANSFSDPVTAVNANITGTDSNYSLFGFRLANQNQSAFLVYTNEYSPGSSRALESMSMQSWQRNAATSTVRFAIQVESNWYASESTFTTNAAIHTQASPVTHTLNFASQNWYPITADIGTSLSIAVSGIAQQLPVGTVNAFGFYGEKGSAKHGTIPDWRMDNFIVAVPEPQTLALFFGAACVAFGFLRRKSGK